MTTIKFDKSVKYKGIRYAAHEAFKVDDEDVVDLRKAGATVLSVDPVEPASQPEPEEAPVGPEGEVGLKGDVAELKEALLGFTIAELTQFAEANGIDLQGKTKKADIYNTVVASLN